MKVQVLKMKGRDDFTVVHDTDNNRYGLYIHVWKPNGNGVYTKRKYLVDWCRKMEDCLAWIIDILRDRSCLSRAISAKKIAS